jgi:CDP-diacylglycerol--serine O-phosphatidyltransferase
MTPPKRPSLDRARLRRGASILPALFTTGNLFAGFWSIIHSFHGEFGPAAGLIVVAIVLDMLDGRIARLTGTTSDFGAELDSLADSISFGVAPAILAYAWGFGALPRSVGWPVAFLFTVCGVLRLARFNVQRTVVDSRFFVGLPIPAGAGQVAALVYFLHERIPQVRDFSQAVAMAALVVVLAFLMVSTFRYWSFKKIDLSTRRSYLMVLGIALLFLLFALKPDLVFLAFTSLYFLSGPTLHLYARLNRRDPLPPPPPEAA